MGMKKIRSPYFDKIALSCIIIVIFSNITNAQFIFPDHFLSPAVVNTSADIIAPRNIISPSNITTTNLQAIPGGSFKLTAGQSIQLNPGFLGAATNSTTSYVLAQIIPSAFDVVIVSPYNGNVGKHEKVELGLKLTPQINAAIDNFFNNSDPTGLKINPYNPDHNDQNYIDVVADFISPTGIHKTVYGFFYRQYDSSWGEISNDYPFRIRFSPDEIGTWTVNINIYNNVQVLNNLTIDPAYYVINCIESSNLGYLEVGHHKTYLRFHDNQKSFFVVGRNIAFPNVGWQGDWNYVETPTDFQVNYDKIEDFSNTGGNYIRLFIAPISYSVECETVNVYDKYVARDGQTIRNRQQNAWELDRIFDLAHSNGFYLQTAILTPEMLQYPVADEAFWSVYPYTWPYAPYNNQTIFPGVNEPEDFFTDSKTKKYYKRKLRYFYSRWGYSTQLAAVELVNEFDAIHDYENFDVQTKAHAWLKEMGGYIKNSLDNNHLMTVSFAELNSGPQHPFFESYIDFTDVHKYSSNKDANYVERSDRVDLLIDNFSKPTSMGEMGNGFPEVDECTDIDLHNASWSSAFMGCMGTGLYWNNWDNASFYQNFTGLASFFQNIDFESNYFTPRKWRNTGTFNWSIACGTLFYPNVNYELENYELVNFDGSLACGWVHNATAYWGNISSVLSCSNADLPCDDDDLYSQSVYIDNPKFKIKGLSKFRQYQYDLYRPEDNTLYYSDFKSSNIFGELSMPLGDGFLWRDDYTYKISRSGSNWRISNSDIEPDTLTCPLDTIYADETYQSDTLGLLNYYWDFGNGQTFAGRYPKVYYNSAGTFMTKLIVSDSTGWSDTLKQLIVVPNCDSTSMRLLSKHNQKSEILHDIQVFPNPSFGTFYINFKSLTNNYNLSIFNAMGELIINEANITKKEYILNLNKYSKGIYLIKISIKDSETFYKKIIIE